MTLDNLYRHLVSSPTLCYVVLLAYYHFLRCNLALECHPTICMSQRLPQVTCIAAVRGAVQSAVARTRTGLRSTAVSMRHTSIEHSNHEMHKTHRAVSAHSFSSVHVRAAELALTPPSGTPCRHVDLSALELTKQACMHAGMQCSVHAQAQSHHVCLQTHDQL